MSKIKAEAQPVSIQGFWNSQIKRSNRKAPQSRLQSLKMIPKYHESRSINATTPGFVQKTTLICRQAKANRQVEEYRHPELDHVNYRREDMSVVHAYEARRQFVQQISKGEAVVDLAECALLVSSEDDALVSHSAVPFPVSSYLQRLQRMAEELANTRLPEVIKAGASPEEQLDVVMTYLFAEKNFRPPTFGRSNVPVAAIVDHPGVWEKPNLAYLNHVLVARQGIPAVLSILLGDILRRLLLSGSIDWVAKIEAKDFGKPPTATVLPGLTRAAAVAADGKSALNACSFETLVECLRYLKRAYWPFPWDSFKGGFRGAATAFIDGQQTAEGEAISRAAAHRLQRGIWTSPGGGDLRRAVAAAEKLVILSGESAGEERRDLAVLYCHCGRLEAAYVELKAYSAWSRAMVARQSSGNTPAFLLSEKGLTSAVSYGDLENQVLVDQLLSMLARVPGNKESNMKPLTLERALNDPPPSDVQLLPLTW